MPINAVHLTAVAALFAVVLARGATITVEFGPAPGVTPDYKEVHVEIGDRFPKTDCDQSPLPEKRLI